MNDFMGNNLSVGDKVVFMSRLSAAKINLDKGVIVSIGKSMATIQVGEEEYDYRKVSVTSEKIYKI